MLSNNHLMELDVYNQEQVNNQLRKLDILFPMHIYKLDFLILHLHQEQTLHHEHERLHQGNE